MGQETVDDDQIMCEVCNNPCDRSIPISEQSIKVEEYTWLCFDPESDSEDAYLHK